MFDSWNGYGTFDGISGTSGDNPLHDVSNLNPTGNIAIIESTRSYFEGIGGSCNFHDSYSGCHDSDSSFSFSAVSNGNVMVGPISYDYFACWVGYGNSSSCSDFG